MANPQALLTNCVNEECQADRSFLRKEALSPFNGGGNVENNPVVVCVSCGTMMVRLGIIGGRRGWAVNLPVRIDWD